MSRAITVERDVMVSMRDGVKLATDIYRPADSCAKEAWDSARGATQAKTQHPVLVHRTPYNKSDAWVVGGLMLNPLLAAERGYVVLVQDTRGRFASEGEWQPFACEGNDGYDTIEWAARQPWSNGNVGIYGSSYNGVTALQAAVAAPPHLKACVAYMTGANYHAGWAYSGGAFELGFNFWWALNLAWDRALRLPEAERLQAFGKLMAAAKDPWKAVREIPLRDNTALCSAATCSADAEHAEHAPFWREWLDHPKYDEFWRSVDVAARCTEIQVPVLQIAGWYDGFLQGHLDLNESLKKHPRSEVRDTHRLVFGPWDHITYMSIRPTAAGEREFGPEAVAGPAGVSELVLEFFEPYLRGEALKSENASQPVQQAVARVRYFSMGENQWRETSSWPPSHAKENFFLHSQGRANTRLGNGELSRRAPTDETVDRYVYDPSDPVPTRGCRSLAPIFGSPGVLDQSEVEMRDDVLVYSSEVLQDALRIAGPVSLELWISSDAPDTDFTAKLVDVDANGYCAPVAEGILRARYRNGMDREAWLTPGEIVPLSISLLDTAYVFLPGHRLRLEVSSSNFPKFDCNPNAKVEIARASASDRRKAKQNVHHDAAHPSCLILPVVRG